MVMAGTPEKMLDHLLETRLEAIANSNGDADNKCVDTFLEDFLLTHPIFMSTKHLCNELMKHYRIDEINTRQEKEFIIANKRRVVRFMQAWFDTAAEAFLRDTLLWTFIQDLSEALERDSKKYSALENEIHIIKTLTDRKTM